MPLAVPSEWLKTGRFHTIVWTRVTQSLGLNPNLPIAGLNKMFPCKKYVPEGIPTAIGDEGSGCIWFAHVIEHNIPYDSLWNKTFGSGFEGAMRRAFFRIAREYPWETLETFVYYKSKAVMDSIKLSLKFNFSAYPPLSIALLLASLGVALVAAATAIEIRRETAVVLVAALFTTTAYLAAYANPATSGDLLPCLLIGAGLALGAILSRATKLTRSAAAT